MDILENTSRPWNGTIETTARLPWDMTLILKGSCWICDGPGLADTAVTPLRN